MIQLLNLTNSFEALGYKWGVSAWFLVYVIIVVYYAFKGNKVESKERSWWISLLFMLVVVFFPPIVNWFCEHYVNTGHIYSRIAWGMMALPVIAYGLIEFINLIIDNKKDRMCYAIILILGIMLLAGNKTDTYFKVPENVYKVPDESVEMIELLDSNSNLDASIVGIAFYVDSLETVSPEEYVFQGMRVYSENYQYIDMNVAILENHSVDYILTKKNVVWKNCTDYGYKKVGSTDSLDLYQYKN